MACGGHRIFRVWRWERVGLLDRDFACAWLDGIHMDLRTYGLAKPKG